MAKALLRENEMFKNIPWMLNNGLKDFLNKTKQNESASKILLAF